ncbi:hypothetical protein NDU88_010913 [Pleurodeles waltl]|uniref:Uncharacterized protein n=1 Tax=Pleurodeles waltl TaxID=8319 RepID=A0AAV7RZK7_PLEWA|nr:hypothetical protein NDU88_010913 [Pleurodeles waltl]
MHAVSEYLKKNDKSIEGDRVRRVLALLEKAGRMDLVNLEALSALRPARQASQGVAAAVLACSPPRSEKKAEQVRKAGWVPGRAAGRGMGWVVCGAVRGLRRIKGVSGKTHRVSPLEGKRTTKDSTRAKGLGAAFTLLPQGNGREQGRGLGSLGNTGLGQPAPVGARNPAEEANLVVEQQGGEAQSEAREMGAIIDFIKKKGGEQHIQNSRAGGV